MRFILVFSVLVICSLAWEPRISPPASQLERIATGTDLYLVCQVSESEVGTDNVELSWFKDGTAMPRQKIRKNGFIQASLAFVKPTTAEAGNYTCRATVGDEIKEQQVSIVFYERAGFANSDSTIHPQEGENAKITCEPKGDRLDEIFWLKNGYQLSEADDRGYQFEDDYQTLIIPDFDSHRDDGNYSCNVVQFAQIYTREIAVTAYSRPIITVFEVPENNSGFEGSSAVFKCGASGKPSPTYEWFKTDDDGSLVELHASDKYKIDDGLLGINYLSESDALDYMCVATNEVGKSNQTTTLKIHRKPKIARMEDVTSVLGNTIKIVCEISSDSDITDAYFMFNKQKIEPMEVTPEPVITTSETSTEDVEDTTESEENVEGPVTPDDNEDQEEAEVTEGTNQRNRRSSNNPMETMFAVWEGKDKLILNIENAQMAHMGRYACHAHNMAGGTYNAAKVLITHAPTFTNTSEKYIRRQEGESAFIYCEVSAVPEAKLTITHNNNAVHPDGANIQLEQLSDKLSLTFNSLETNDFGKYQCTASNSEGTAAPADFEIIRILPPKDPKSVTCTENIYPNYAVCIMDGYTEERGEWPTRFHVFYTTDSVDTDFDWENDASKTEATFDGEKVLISELSPSSRYFARFRAINEAGEGELTDVSILETTVPWAPQPVTDAVIDCPDICSVNWTAPNDNGAELTGYKLIYKETTPVTNDGDEVVLETSEEQDEDEIDAQGGDTIDIGPDDHHVDLPQLLPLRNYRLTIYAINEVGLSTPTHYYFRTTEKSGLATLFPLPNWAVITLFVAFGLIVAIALDAFCCKTRHCGIIACISSHFRNRRNRIPKDIEQGNVSGEHRVLLTKTETTVTRTEH